jgi:hypothetical protein
MIRGNFIQLIIEFGENYWETICSILNLLKSNIVKALIIIITAISYLFIGMTYFTQINDFEYKDISWLLLIIFLPYLIMPFTFTAKCKKLQEKLDNRQKKDELVLKLRDKIKVIDLYIDNKSYSDLCKEIVQIMQDSGIISESEIFEFEHSGSHLQRTDLLKPEIAVVRQVF